MKTRTELWQEIKEKSLHTEKNLNYSKLSIEDMEQILLEDKKPYLIKEVENDNLKKKTVKQLKEIASDFKLPVTSKMLKKDLIKLIQDEFNDNKEVQLSDEQIMKIVEKDTGRVRPAVYVKRNPLKDKFQWIGRSRRLFHRILTAYFGKVISMSAYPLAHNHIFGAVKKFQKRTVRGRKGKWALNKWIATRKEFYETIINAFIEAEGKE